jgi:site-specific DNA-methyltransferase (cytosine-N4-specific)
VGVGVDLNPLAVFIARVKVGCLDIDPAQLEETVESVLSAIARDAQRYGLSDDLLGTDECRRIVADATWLRLAAKLPNLEYLRRWFDREAVAKLSLVQTHARSVADQRVADLCLLAASDIARDFSLQDPEDLRVRRRKDLPPSYRLLERYAAELRQACRAVYAYAAVRPYVEPPAASDSWRIHHADVRRLHAMADPLLSTPESVDAIITSPPYATALPYIDTDRLSLFLLGLMTPGSRGGIERNMIGNREISPVTRRALEADFFTRNGVLPIPPSIKELLLKIHRLNSIGGAGFRRQNMLSLLYKYFSDMRAAFLQARRVLKPGATMTVVIGNNHTIAGGERVEIETDRLLVELAESVGFEFESAQPMTDQAGYMAHSRNMVKSETIFTMRKPKDAPSEWRDVHAERLEVAPALG